MNYIASSTLIRLNEEGRYTSALWNGGVKVPCIACRKLLNHLDACIECENSVESYVIRHEVYPILSASGTIVCKSDDAMQDSYPQSSLALY